MHFQAAAARTSGSAAENAERERKQRQAERKQQAQRERQSYAFQSSIGSEVFRDDSRGSSRRSSQTSSRRGSKDGLRQPSQSQSSAPGDRPTQPGSTTSSPLGFLGRLKGQLTHQKATARPTVTEFDSSKVLPDRDAEQKGSKVLPDVPILQPLLLAATRALLWRLVRRGSPLRCLSHTEFPSPYLGSFVRLEEIT